MSLKITMRTMMIATSLGFATATALPAFAQDTMQAPAAQAPAEQTAPAAPQAAPQATAPAASYDEAKLQSFVVAFLQVDQINRTYAPQLQAAEGEEAQNTVREEASEQMVQAVQSVDGMTVEEYGSIIQQAQTDPALAEQINGYIQEAVGQPAAPAGEPAAPAQPAPAE